MTHVEKQGDKTLLALAEEPPGKCELCGAVEETRPYGPGGKQVCFPCGMKDPEEVGRQFDLRIQQGD